MSLITSGLKNCVIVSDGLPSLAKLVVPVQLTTGAVLPHKAVYCLNIICSLYLNILWFLLAI